MTTICPRCGATLHDETNPTCYNCLGIERDQKRYGKGRPFRPKTYPPPPPFVEPPMRERDWETAVVPGKVDRQRQRRAFNLLLRDLYGSNRLLSNILRDGKMSPQEINQLKQEKMPRFLDDLAAGLLKFWKKTLSWQEYEMLHTKYALDGTPPPQKKSLMKQFNFSWERIDKYRAQALLRLRGSRNIASWEKLVLETARATLRGKR